MKDLKKCVFVVCVRVCVFSAGNEANVSLG